MKFFSPFKPLLKGWLLSFLGFGFVACAISVQFVSFSHAPFEAAVRSSLRDWLPWAVLAPLLFRLTSRYPIGRRHLGSHLAIHIYAAVIVFALAHWWKGMIDPGFRAAPGGADANHLGGEPRFAHDERPWPPPPPPFRGDGPPPMHEDGPPPFHDEGPPPDEPPGPPPNEFRRRFARTAVDLVHIGTFQLPIYLMIMSAAHAALFCRLDRERAASLARARLDVLMTQLQPHFLFNTLNTIAELVHQDPNKADEMITALSEMLRLTLDANATQLVPLQQEAEFVERYFSIMQTRFGDRLQYECNIAPAARRGLVPPFLLQPLAENAIRHGLEPKPEGGRVTIEATVMDEVIRIVVRDNGVGLPEGEPKREGLGLANTRERLQQLYGDAAQVKLSNGNGVQVEVTLPFKVA